MLNLILHNLEKYPLNGVVHFELEIDYPSYMMLLTIWNLNVKDLVFHLSESSQGELGKNGTTTNVLQKLVSKSSTDFQQDK